ncbi:MAG: DUF3048 domain-containing protein [Patescibacteria group bacterium]
MFIKRNWPLLLCGAVLILGVTSLLMYLIISGNIRKDASAATSEAIEGMSGLVHRKLDGVLVSPDQAELQSYAVMIDNSADSGLALGSAKANLAIEAEVEGGITRFMLVFDESTELDEIGPVRSAREYYVDWAYSLSSVYAHVGGSPASLNLISLLNTFRDLSEISNGKYFWRSQGRAAPHNVFTSMESLKLAKENKGWSNGAFQVWEYSTTSERGDTESVVIPYQGGFKVEWKFDGEENKYERYQGKKMQKDADGESVTASNIVVLLTEAEVVDDIGRLDMRTKGSGKAVLYRNGNKIEGTWSRRAGEWIKFQDFDGNDLEFEPGTTWIEVVTRSDM